MNLDSHPKLNHKLMYFFNYNDTSNLKLSWLFLRMLGCLLIGQRILAVSSYDDDGDVRIYFYYK